MFSIQKNYIIYEHRLKKCTLTNNGRNCCKKGSWNLGKTRMGQVFQKEYNIKINYQSNPCIALNASRKTYRNTNNMIVYLK